MSDANRMGTSHEHRVQIPERKSLRKYGHVPKLGRKEGMKIGYRGKDKGIP
jgi:hypothetical protein